MNYIFRRLNVDVDATDVDVNCNTINFESQDAVDVENMQNHVKGMKIYRMTYLVCGCNQA